MKKNIARLLSFILSLALIVPLGIFSTFAADMDILITAAPNEEDNFGETDTIEGIINSDDSVAAEVSTASDENTASKDSGKNNDGMIASELPDRYAVPISTDKGIQGSGSVDFLDKHWAQNGIPDYVSYIYMTGGENISEDVSYYWYDVGIVNAGDVEKEAILSTASPSCFINFVECSASYSQRNDIYKEIAAMEDSKIQSIQLSLNTEQIFIYVFDSAVSDYEKILTEKYGDIIKVIPQSDAAYDDAMTVGIDTAAKDKNNDTFLFIAASVLLCLSLTAFVIIRRKAQLSVTAEGKAIQSVALTKKEIKNAVRQSEYTPSNDIFNRIKKNLDK